MAHLPSFPSRPRPGPGSRGSKGSSNASGWCWVSGRWLSAVFRRARGTQDSGRREMAKPFVGDVADESDRGEPIDRGSEMPGNPPPIGHDGPGDLGRGPGRRVSVCCEACVPKLKTAPAEYLDLGPRDTSTPEHVMSVPESAVVDTGTKTIVYVEASPGVFEGRAVVLGPRSGDSFPVLDGLAPGEEGGGRRRVSDRRREPAQPRDPGPCRAFPGGRLPRRSSAACSVYTHCVITCIMMPV